VSAALDADDHMRAWDIARIQVAGTQNRINAHGGSVALGNTRRSRKGPFTRSAWLPSVTLAVTIGSERDAQDTAGRTSIRKSYLA